MAELFRNLSTGFPDIGVGALNRVSPNGFTTSTLVTILLGALVVLFVALMLLNKPIDLSWLDPRPKSMQTTFDAYLFWKPSAIFTNLTVKKSEVPGFINNTYSVIMDCVLKNTRTFKGTGGPWRQIMHRGSDELATTTIGGSIIRSGCAAASNAGGALPPFGLPKRMNPGIFLDPNTNDIIVFVDTERGGDMYRESVRLVDIPMDIPFRIGIIVNGKVLEIYLNCKLEVSKVLSGTPRSVENVWYGLSGAAAAQAQIQNLYIWKRALLTDEIGSLCKSPVTFINERPICDSADSTTTMKIDAKEPESQISYGGAICKPA
jgi:hypothetical protein